MQIRPRKRMGFLLIAIAPLFLWNADIAVFDLLPDVIGYSLIALGMSSLSYLNYHFEESAKRFNRMVALSAARLAYVLVLFGLVNSVDRPTTMLLGNFVFGVLELMIVLPAYKHFFEGLIYAGSRAGVGQSIFKPTAWSKLWSLVIKRKSEFDDRNTAVTATESFSFMTALFAVLKILLNVLPEFTVLTEQSEKVVNLYAYVWMFRAAAVLLGTLVGGIWLLMALRYYIGVLRDCDFVQLLHAQYMKDVYPNKDLFVARRYKLCSLLLLFGVILSADLPMDGVNLLPDLLCAICLIAGIWLLRHYLTAWKSALAVLAAYFTVSVLEYYWQIRYFKIEGYSAEAALKGAEATDAHTVSIVFSAIGALLFVLVVASVLRCLKEIIRAHTGYEIKHTDMQTYGRMNTLHKQLIRGLVPVQIMAIVCALGSVAYTVMIPYARLGGEWFYVLASLMWVINLFLSVVFVVIFSEKNNDIMEQLHNRYMLTGVGSGEQAE